MKNTKVVLFTSNGTIGNVVYDFLSKNYDVVSVVFDSPGSKSFMVKRRIKKMGFFKVFRQLIFMRGLVPLLEKEGRKRKEEILSSFNTESLKSEVNIFKPSSINDPKVVEHVNSINPDVIMVCGTRIIKKQIIEGLKAPLLNMHVGITPKYRGVHGGYWALVNKDLENCGVTVHYIDPGIDTGGVISQKRITPTKKDNYITYPYLQVIKGLECIKEAIGQIENGGLTTIKNGLPSKLYYHPTINTYLYHRFFKGVK
ncbi:hypothetical protein KIM67_07255 [Flagellimonas sp. 389]|uniref:formyl transferase n=1 Tax=Flagellimonas sp. 389 TaxID=2835862 RepID=UPI001BD2E336|nr:formyl transferase [Flagellimonas sp. 389]MBS9462203.1 hypothetical protein [Flagellimonas sp. 389]